MKKLKPQTGNNLNSTWDFDAGELSSCSDDEEPQEKGEKVGPQGNILCCCKPHLPHNEAMKFKLLYNDESAVEHTPFEDIQEGTINDLNQERNDNIKLNLVKN
jgi:hypothetical protein